MTHPAVAAVVLNWNRPDLTDRAIVAIGREAPEPRVIVVDNGSTDDSIDIVHARHPAAELVALDTNRGFAGGVNAGIGAALAAGAEWVWLLNNDTEATEGALAALLRTGESDDRIGAIGSILAPLGEASRTAYGARVRWWLGSAQHDYVRGRSPEYLVGASLLLRRAAIEEVGLFDERFFLYWEDVDYSLRLRRAGWRLAVAAGSVVGHRQKATLGPSAWEAYMAHSSVHFFRKHAAVPAWPIAAGATIRMLRCLATGRPHDAWRVVTATARALAGRPIRPPVPSAAGGSPTQRAMPPSAGQR